MELFVIDVFASNYGHVVSFSIVIKTRCNVLSAFKLSNEYRNAKNRLFAHTTAIVVSKTFVSFLDVESEETQNISEVCNLSGFSF